MHNSLYNAGDTISFSGIGTDAEDGTVLPDSAYNWTVVFHHADHVHPFRDNIVGPTGTVTIPRSADNIDTTFYRITLTVTDSSGLSTSQLSGHQTTSGHSDGQRQRPRCDVHRRRHPE